MLNIITQICRAYLCEGNVYLNKATPIAWTWFCLPRKNGGLGIRDCIIWNVAAVGKLVWQVAQKEDVLWIKWVHEIYIREEN